MVCPHCAGKGTIVKDVGAGMYFFSPCYACGVHNINKQKAEDELQHMLESLSTT